MGKSLMVWKLDLDKSKSIRTALVKNFELPQDPLELTKLFKNTHIRFLANSISKFGGKKLSFWNRKCLQYLIWEVSNSPTLRLIQFPESLLPLPAAESLRVCFLHPEPSLLSFLNHCLYFFAWLTSLALSHLFKLCFLWSPFLIFLTRSTPY